MLKQKNRRLKAGYQPEKSLVGDVHHWGTNHEETDKARGYQEGIPLSMGL